jgi:hypothetical protein
MFVSYQQIVGQNHSVHVKRNPFENVEEFDYLGTKSVNYNKLYMEKLKVVVAGSDLVQSLLSSHHAQNVTKHTKPYFFLFCMGVELVSRVERRALTEGTRKQGAEENISICKGGSSKPPQKIT